MASFSPAIDVTDRGFANRRAPRKRSDSSRWALVMHDAKAYNGLCLQYCAYTEEATYPQPSLGAQGAPRENMD